MVGGDETELVCQARESLRFLRLETGQNDGKGRGRRAMVVEFMLAKGVDFFQRGPSASGKGQVGGKARIVRK